MPQKKRKLNRDEGVVLDAPLIVIASEDTYAVQQYFGRFRTQRLQFVCIPTEDTRSSPAAVKDRLDKYKAENAIQDYDQFWVCIDLDHWAQPNHIGNLVEVLKHCNDKNYRVAICKPCFELWILLHFENPDFSAMTSCAEVEARLKHITGGYNKARCCGSFAMTKDNVMAAFERARAIENGDPIPNRPQARIHLILSELLAKEAIDFI